MIRRNYELANMNSFHSSLRKNRLLANVLRFCFTLDSFFYIKKHFMTSIYRCSTLWAHLMREQGVTVYLFEFVRASFYFHDPILEIQNR